MNHDNACTAHGRWCTAGASTQQRSCAYAQRERRELRAHLGCGLWVRHGAAGSVGTGVGGGGAIASELELGGHRHKHGERRGSTKYSPRSFMAARRNRGRPSARRGWSIVLDVGLGNGLGTTQSSRRHPRWLSMRKTGTAGARVGFYGAVSLENMARRRDVDAADFPTAAPDAVTMQGGRRPH